MQNLVVLHIVHGSTCWRSICQKLSSQFVPKSKIHLSKAARVVWPTVVWTMNLVLFEYLPHGRVLKLYYYSVSKSARYLDAAAPTVSLKFNYSRPTACHEFVPIVMHMWLEFFLLPVWKLTPQVLEHVRYFKQMVFPQEKAISIRVTLVDLRRRFTSFSRWQKRRLL